MGDSGSAERLPEEGGVLPVSNLNNNNNEVEEDMICEKCGAHPRRGGARRG